MLKRSRSISPSLALNESAHKIQRTHRDVKFLPNKIATAENAARADKNPPFKLLMEAMQSPMQAMAKGDAVVYWMRMQDMRVQDNRALSQASMEAVQSGLPLIALFIISPQDYVAHDRSARRIDFTLRNLKCIKETLGNLHIPLHIVNHSPRKTLPERVLSILRGWNAVRLFANIEHEVDELRRDVRVCELTKKEGRVKCTFVNDKCIIIPGTVRTKEGKGYTVYSPFLRSWLPHLSERPDPLASAAKVQSNQAAIRDHVIFGQLFNDSVPDQVDGFQLAKEDADTMRECFPAGEDAAHEILRRFLHTKTRASQGGAVDPLNLGFSEAKDSSRDSRIGKYKDMRDRVDMDTTSRLSPYLAAGVISSRACVRATLELSKNKVQKIDASRETGIGRWVQELAWRDFYTHVLALFPRVSMGRPFQEKFANVSWETNEEHLQAWKDGRTGVPIVDAGMRQANKMGWMHNRVRMITAMYLVKDLMIDWRLGEKYYMETLIDGDLASNNGGWQWSASTGVDPVPYFRIFNPYTQSKKADPTGDYIRYFIPELSKVSEMVNIHNPPAKLAQKLGYPLPLVRHDEARQRAIRRYKNPGDE
ncbi:DNA photolyase, FAD-binding/Cryptochrome [Irpex lacteus]|nr:DNA photolyase, FAD-binding/Cryptochrome [Irpex lacteus]